MKELKIYTYIAGEWTRNTVTAQEIPEDEKSGICRVSWFSDELLEHYASPQSFKYNTLYLDFRPDCWGYNGRFTQVAMKDCITRVASFFTNAAKDLMDEADDRVGDRWVSRLNLSVCRAIAHVLHRLGLRVKITTAEVQDSSLKTWHSVHCEAEDTEGIPVEIDIIPMFDEYCRRTHSPKAHLPGVCFICGSRKVAAYNLVRDIKFQADGTAVSERREVSQMNLK